MITAIQDFLRRDVERCTVATDGVYTTRSGSRYAVTSAGDVQSIHRIGGDESLLARGQEHIFTGVAVLATLVEDGCDRLVVVDMGGGVVLHTSRLAGT
jgi:hypothetical protein